MDESVSLGEIRRLCGQQIRGLIEENRCDPIILRCFLEGAMIEITMAMVEEYGVREAYNAVQKLADGCAAPPKQPHRS